MHYANNHEIIQLIYHSHNHEIIQLIYHENNHEIIQLIYHDNKYEIIELVYHKNNKFTKPNLTQPLQNGGFYFLVREGAKNIPRGGAKKMLGGKPLPPKMGGV